MYPPACCVLCFRCCCPGCALHSWVRCYHALLVILVPGIMGSRLEMSPTQGDMCGAKKGEWKMVWLVPFSECRTNTVERRIVSTFVSCIRHFAAQCYIAILHAYRLVPCFVHFRSATLTRPAWLCRWPVTRAAGPRDPPRDRGQWSHRSG